DQRCDASPSRAGRAITSGAAAHTGAVAHAILRRRSGGENHGSGHPMTSPSHALQQTNKKQTSRSSMAGLGTMVRFILRRDRIRLPVWIAAHGLLVLYIGAALPQLAPDKQDLAGMTPLFSQPVGRMFTGPAFGLD